ncbi:MAG: mycothiol synthase, partial [Acidimicrobiia bacterium]
MVEVRVVREVGPADLAELGELLAAAEAADGHAPIGEHHWLDLVRRNLDCYSGLIATDPPHPHPVGYGHLSCDPSSNPRQWALEIAVDPSHRGVGVEVALVASARTAVEDAGGGLLRLWVYRPTEIHEALAHRFDLRRERDLLQLRRPLPHPELPTWPVEVRVRSFGVGEDEADLVKVNNAAFEGHPEQGRWEEEVLVKRQQESWFDPAGFLIAEDSRGLAGFCWTKIHHRG